MLARILLAFNKKSFVIQWWTRLLVAEEIAICNSNFRLSGRNNYSVADIPAFGNLFLLLHIKNEFQQILPFWVQHP